MIDLDIIPRFTVPLWAKILLILLFGASCFFGGWHVRGWKAGKDIADIHTKAAENEAKKLGEQLQAITAAATKIQASATESIESRKRLEASIAALMKQRKEYVKANPLPAGCRPDAGRVRQLEEAINSANESISGTR